MKRYIFLLAILTSSLMIIISSCQDELLYNPAQIGEGQATVSFNMRFESIVPALDNTRASGTAIKKIQNVSVVIYDRNGQLFEVYKSDLPENDPNKLVEFKISVGANTNLSPDRPSGTQTIEGGTDIATFKIPALPYGEFYFYAVANVDLDKYIEEGFSIQTPDELKSIVIDWDNDPANVALNNAMFGVFLGNNSSPVKTTEYTAPAVRIDKTTVSLSAWIRRLASKVTVDFDPSGLYESVFVYIKSVTIHDIPKACLLGKNNQPTTADSLYTNGETIYYTEDKTDTPDHDKWLELNKSTKWVKSTDTSDAMFFFENMQGDFEGQKKYYKPQIQGETGTSINAPDNIENGIPNNDFKDRRLYGTYIEVEAYYNSQNPNRISSGPIKYRFMLGQNITYNYNAIRNHHYRVTLKFNGWANEPDWHIVYDEPTPTIFLPEQYYISYLYNQQMEMPVRIVGLSEEDRERYYLHSEITENNWIPYDPDTKTYPESQVGEYSNINGFAWYEQAYLGSLYSYVDEKDGVRKPYNYFGFLSLRAGHENIVGNTMSYGSASYEFLKKYYNGERAEFGSGENEYIQTSPRWWARYDLDQSGEFDILGNSQDGKYKVSYTTNNNEEDIMVTVPMYTRAKELVSSTDFTGNNIFDAYQRKAVVRFTLRDKITGDPIPFKIMDSKGGIDETTYRDMPIYQVRRIVNPKAIWRKHDSTEPFNVRLMHLDDAERESFSTFESEGKWRVSVLTDPKNLIKINGKQLAPEEYIEGSTGTEIKFLYTPNGTIGASESRCGIIKVEYHDYTCVHLIFVRQGYDDPNVLIGGSNWSCYNAVATTTEDYSKLIPQDPKDVDVVVTNSPLSIGSFFKRNQYNYAILEKNNQEYGWLKKIGSLETAVVTPSSKNKPELYETRSANWDDFWGWAWTNSDGKINRRGNEWADTWTVLNTDPQKNGKKLTVPTLEDYRNLRDDPNVDYGYGVVYGDGSLETLEDISDVYGFVDYDNDGMADSKNKDDQNRGMRVCIVYDKTNGNQIIFPLGSIGQGRRARTISGTNAPFNMPNPGLGALTYTNLLGPLWTAGNITVNAYRPLTYNDYRFSGAVYWFKKPGLKDYKPSTDPTFDIASWDINYTTLVFNPYSYNSLALHGHGEINASTSSDALPIKFIYK